MYKWFLAWRYLHTKLIAFFGVAAVMLCVAMVLVVMSVMGGFLETIRTRSKGLTGEIVLEGGTLQGFPYYAEFAEHVKDRLPDVVERCTPVLYTYGIFRVPATTWTKPARVIGIHLEEYAEVTTFGKGLHYGRFYPGTTHLGKQGMPVAGYDEDTGRITLPEEFELASAEWRKQETDQEVIAEYEASPFEIAPYPYITSSFPGERVFQASPGEPGFADPQHFGIIVGCDVLHARREDGGFKRQIARGTDMALGLFPLTGKGNPTGEPLIRLPLRYADDSHTGIFEIDSLCVYVDFDMLQHKLAMDPQELIDGGQSKPRTNQLLISLKEGNDLDESCRSVGAAWGAFLASVDDDLSEDEANALGFVEVYTWEDLQRPFIAAVEKEKVLVTILFSLISGVAIVLIGCIFYMIVEKKTRDIGILKALGASPGGVATLFILYAAAVGVMGSILGTIIGVLFVRNINAIQDSLASLNPALRVWSADVYSFDRIPEIVNPSDALWVASIAVVSSMVGSVIPAVVAGRVWPVQALRYE